MGFESSRAARKRLAAIAATNECVQEALSPATFPGLFGSPTASADPTSAYSPSAYSPSAYSSSARQRRAEQEQLPAHAAGALARQLELLAQDIAATPGAGGALLAAYAAQARALLMVVEAARRAGQAPLPTAVINAARDALQTPVELVGLV